MKCKNCRNYDRNDEWCCIYEYPDPDMERECDCYNQMTNVDRIRTMTDEELAEWLHNLCQGFDDEDEEEPIVSIYNLDAGKEDVIHDSYGDLLEWLRKPMEV